MSPQFGDYQFEIYLDGLRGVVPTMPSGLRRTGGTGRAALPPSVWSYVAAARATSTPSGPTSGPSNGTA